MPQVDMLIDSDNAKNFYIKGDSSVSSQTMQMRAWDGKDWGPWANFTVNTNPANKAPVIKIIDQLVSVNTTKNISSAVSTSDPDGDTITKYKVKDTTGINSFYVSGSAVNATGVNGYEFAANALSTLSVKGDASTGTQMLQIAAYDGEDWSDWTNFILTTTAPNNLPTVSNERHHY